MRTLPLVVFVATSSRGRLPIFSHTQGYMNVVSEYQHDARDASQERRAARRLGKKAESERIRGDRGEDFTRSSSGLQGSRNLCRWLPLALVSFRRPLTHQEVRTMRRLCAFLLGCALWLLRIEWRMLEASRGANMRNRDRLLAWMLWAVPDLEEIRLR